MIRRPPRSTQSRSSAASDVYKRQLLLRRTLHTFKGSARMAGAMRLGEIAHQMESRLVEVDTPVVGSATLFEALDTDLDRIAFVLDRLRAGEANSALPWIASDTADADASQPDSALDEATDRALVVPIGSAAASVAPLPASPRN